MLKLTIEINGNQVGDLELAIEQVLDLVSKHFTSGFDSNETGNYKFTVEGEEKPDDVPDEGTE